MIYNKLVRDRILEIIEKDGKKPNFRILNQQDYLWEARKKIFEEAKELVLAGEKEDILTELIDVQELIDILISGAGLTRRKFRKLQKKRRKKRGGFKKRIFLINTEEKSPS